MSQCKRILIGNKVIKVCKWNRMLGRPEPQDPAMRTMREEAAKVYPNTQKYYSDEVNMAIRNRQAFLPGQHLDNVKVSQ